MQAKGKSARPVSRPTLSPLTAVPPPPTVPNPYPGKSVANWYTNELNYRRPAMGMPPNTGPGNLMNEMNVRRQIEVGGQNPWGAMGAFGPAVWTPAPSGSRLPVVGTRK